MIILQISSTEQTEMIDVTSQIAKQVIRNGITDGLAMLFVPHTTAGITINEGADPAVQSDVLMVMNKMIPWKDAYRHIEGNSPAHVKTSLFGSSELIAIENRRLVLGKWQSVYFCEFDGPRSRKLYLKLIQG